MKNITIRLANERGRGGADWLDSRFSFSFADYHDPAHMGFRSLRVINDDRIAGGGGFQMHPHRDMEIITYVMQGALAHRDSLGNGATIRPGEIQKMSAGAGILHSEFNASATEPVHLLQIWIIPNKRGVQPSYGQERIDDASVTGKFGLLAAPEGEKAPVMLHQDARLWLAKLAKGESASFELASHRGAWVQVAKGAIMVDDQPLREGDGASWEEAGNVRFTATEEAQILLFDMA